MGFDLSRFTDIVDEEFKCSICTDVFEQPVQFSKCEHMFCEACINVWLSRQSSCPFGCDQNLSSSDLEKAPRVFRTFLGRLNLRCDYYVLGCSTVVKLDGLDAHVKQCRFDPSLPASCAHGCGLRLASGQESCENCVDTLRREMVALNETVGQLRKQLSEQSSTAQLTQMVEQLKKELSDQQTAQAAVTQELRAEVAMLKRQLGSLQQSPLAPPPPPQGSSSRGSQFQYSRSSSAAAAAAASGQSSHAQAPPQEDLSPVERWCFSLRVVEVRPAVWMDLKREVSYDFVDDTLPTVGKCLERSGSPRYLIERFANRDIYNTCMKRCNVDFYAQNASVRRIPGCAAVVAMAVDNMELVAQGMPKPGILFAFPKGAL